MKLQKLTTEQLQAIPLKELYGYRQDWYEKYRNKLSESAWNEFTKAKRLIKKLENWEDQSVENWKTFRRGIHTYNDFLQIVIEM